VNQQCWERFKDNSFQTKMKKKFFLIVAVTMLATNLPAPVTINQPQMAIINLGNGNCGIITSPLPAGLTFEVQRSTNLVNWTSIVTNSATGYSITNSVRATNSASFYRAMVPLD